MERDIKHTKIQELQEETQVYQAECLKLRNISEQAVFLLIRHGLLPHVKVSKELKRFAKQVKKNPNLVD